MGCNVNPRFPWVVLYTIRQQAPIRNCYIFADCIMHAIGNCGEC